MVKLPEGDEREIITRAPLLDELLGEMVAHHHQDGPLIDMEIKPVETDIHAKWSFTPQDARELAAQLVSIADIAQRAGWTSKLIANVRTNYLPGASDEEIIRRLDQLVEREGGLELVRPGYLRPHDGNKLAAIANHERIDRVAEALSAAGVGLDELASVVDDLKHVYETAMEPDQ